MIGGISLCDHLLPVRLSLLKFAEIPKIVPSPREQAFNYGPGGEISYLDHSILPLCLEGSRQSHAKHMQLASQSPHSFEILSS